MLQPQPSHQPATEACRLEALTDQRRCLDVDHGRPWPLCLPGPVRQLVVGLVPPQAPPPGAWTRPLPLSAPLGDRGQGSGPAGAVQRDLAAIGSGLLGAVLAGADAAAEDQRPQQKDQGCHDVCAGDYEGQLVVLVGICTTEGGRVWCQTGLLFCCTHQTQEQGSSCSLSWDEISAQGGGVSDAPVGICRTLLVL